jgi:Na+/H+-dicarboxylate symporter
LRRSARTSLATQVLTGLAAGIVVGVFLGELIAPVGIVGQAFILLLQMTVLPYIVVSLVTGLGSLTAREAAELARRAGGFLLLLWGIALTAVVLFSLVIPDWTSASFFSSTLVEQPPAFDLLRLFIPANPFESLADNSVPAVVVFSIALGIALIGIENTGSLVRSLSRIAEALGRITGFVVRLAPIGVFAIAAQAAGTMDLDEALGLQVYAAGYIALALFLSLWVLPGLVTTLTPFRYREVVGMSRDALVTAFATGNVFIVLSLLAEKSKELIQLHAENAEEGARLAGVVVPTSFSVPSCGKLLPLCFILFAGWLSGFPVSVTEYPALVSAGLFTFFGHTFVAIPFLLDMFRIPADMFQLFVVADSIFGRFGTLLAAMHILCLTLLSASGAAGLIRVDWTRIGRYVAITAVAGIALLLGIRVGFETLGHQYQGYQRFIERELLDEGVPVRVLESVPEVGATNASVPALTRIRERGVLRIGYLADQLPMAFQNDAGQLVGFDVELMHHLARDFGVRLEFVELEIADVAPLLASGAIDLSTGLAVTPERMGQLSFSKSYLDATLAFVVEDHRREEFGSRAAVKALTPLRLAVPALPYYVRKIRDFLPQAEIIEIDSPRAFFQGKMEGVDAIVLTAEAGSAWSLIYPQFAVAVPQPYALRVPIAFPVASGDGEMTRFLNRWIDLKERDGTRDRLFDYWIRGRIQEKRTPRWSVIRDLLGWVE